MSDVITELLVVSPTPQNLERGDLWFRENSEAIKKHRLRNAWWLNNSTLLEQGQVIKLSELSRKFLDWGYERTSVLHGRGLFAVKGGLIEIWPVNTERPYLIEFRGNEISGIYEREVSKEPIKHKILARHSELDKLPLGSLVVHEDHGIGIFRGITAKNQIFVQEQKQSLEFFIIEYAPPRPGAEPDRLYVPKEKKERITPYIGFETPTIHRLGGNLWEKSKRKAKEDAQKMAKELAQIYAQRQLAERSANDGDISLENSLRGSFLYQETPDQLKAEQEILRDLESKNPMDRILCGDVGFGKTEIALRAALRVIASGRQVALLAPTTILVAQHHKTMINRFENTPVKTSALSRLTPPQEEKNILKNLAEGTIDCVVGTHRLLSKDMNFKNLGLVIIDEEQRFGVRQKERLKEFRASVDVLSLSATPIPRTMHMILSNLRSVSVLETPPPERMPIKTSVLPHSLKTMTEAINFELDRNGQVYFLHNRIETMAQVKKKLEKRLKAPRHTDPRKFIAVLHGRMSEKEIIKVMEQFYKGETKILLATTIIENGLDISSANTLIVDDATRLGLSEAHQLRGRIGRGSVQAAAYFFYKPRHLTELAASRLEALTTYSQLGSGYEIAMQDLEIRGAGNLLGREQSGAINRIGLNLYYQILQEAIEEEKIKQGSFSPLSS